MSSPAIDLLMRAVILLAAAWVAVVSARRRSASLRALIWTSALGGLLILPLVSRVMPSWRVEVWRAPAAAAAPVDLRQTLPLPVQVSEPASGRGGIVAAPRVTDDARPQIAAQPFVPAPAAASLTWSDAALLLWASITALLLIRIAASHVRLTRIAANASAAVDLESSWMVLVDETCARLGIRRAVALRATGEVNVPAIVGVWRPVLLLPADADEWTPDVRRAVVLHELAHVARWDALAQLIGQLACCVYWVLPIVWHGARRAASLRERASDDIVLQEGVRSASYADTLIRLARLAGGGELRAAALAMARPSRMRERVTAILDPASRRDAVTLRATIAILVIVTSGMTALAVVEPIAADAMAPGAPPSVGASALVPDVAPDVTIDAPAPPAVPVRPQRATPAPPPSPPSPQSSRLCGRGLDQSSSSIHEDTNTRKWTVRLTGTGCSVDLRAEGKIEFNADFTDIGTISSGGFFRVDVTDQGVRRQIEIESRNGTLSRTWRVDGSERPYDDDARAWLAAFLIELDRRTAVGVDIRLPLLLRQGGPDAVLQETALMPGDYPRGRYYATLARSTKLTPAELTRLLKQATSLTTSDYYAAELLKAIASHGLEDSTVRMAVIALIDRMESDYYRAESVAVLIGAGRPSAGEMELLLRTVPRMESDHYKVQTLTKILAGGRLDATQQVALARAAASIEGDYYAAEFLKAIADAGPMPPAVRQAFVEAVKGIDSDHYAAEVLTTLIKRETPSAADVDSIIQLMPAIESDHYRNEVLARLLAVKLSERDLLGIIEAARLMKSDSNKSDVLKRVAVHASATARVNSAVLAAADGMSKHYADEVRRVVGRQ